MSNTKLWDSVFKTDPAHTKGFQRTGGFKGTAIKPLYLIHKATELWGPMGSKWGAETAEYVIHKDMVFVKASLWYPQDGAPHDRGTVEHWGGDVLVKSDKPNDEAFKMAFTDAVGKCLVQLGFSADVHLGMFDDNKYVEDRKAEEAKTPTTKQIYGTHAAMKTKFNEIVEEMEGCDSHEGLASTWKSNNHHILAMKGIDESFYDELVKRKDAMKKTIADKLAELASFSQGFNEVRN